jgi:hypothetical protein
MTDHTDTTPMPAPDVPRVAPGRRGLLGGATALLTGAAAVALPRAVLAAGACPDAALLALHRDFLVHHAVVDAWNVGAVGEDVGESAHDHWWQCIRTAETMQAHTLAGLRAKADIALKGLVLVADSESDADDLARGVLGQIAAWGTLS